MPTDASAAEFGYRPVYVRGQFLHDQELFVAPRTRDGEVGAHVVTPLQLASGCVRAPQHGRCRIPANRLQRGGTWYAAAHSDTVLVDRGWVPRAQLDPSTRSAGQVRCPLCGDGRHATPSH